MNVIRSEVLFYMTISCMIGIIRIEKTIRFYMDFIIRVLRLKMPARSII